LRGATGTARKMRKMAAGNRPIPVNNPTDRRLVFAP